MRRKPVLTPVPDQLASRRERERLEADPDRTAAAEDEDAAEPLDTGDGGEREAGAHAVPPRVGRRTSRMRRPHPTVVLEVSEQEVRVGPGETLGTRIREAMIEGGAAEDDAIRVHRDHARLHYDDEGLYFLERLGENTLRVNGQPVPQNTRIRIVDGDRVTFSDVVTAFVRIEHPGSESRPQAARRADSQPPRDALGGGDGQVGLQRSLATLTNTIPAEVLLLWSALEGATDLYNLPVWASGVFLVLVVLATPVYVYRSIDTPGSVASGGVERWWQTANVRWQSLSATGAFLVWVYYLGGPFQAAGLHDPALATVGVIVYPILMAISPKYGSLILYTLSSLRRGTDGGSQAQ